MTFQLYIGANNRTHRVEKAKIERIVSARHEGFSLVTGVTGYWLGAKEQSVMVVIEDDEAKTLETIAILKSELEQDAIAYQVAPEMRFA